MAWLSVVRLVTFVMVVLFAAVVLSLSVDLITIYEPFYLKFTGLAVAIGGLTLLTVIPMFLIDVVKQCRGNIIIVDIVWLSVLWALWLSSGSYTVWSYTSLYGSDPLVSSCDLFFYDDLDTRVCQEFKVIMFLSFPAGIFLMVYTVILLFVAILAQNRGHNVWGKSVREPAIFYAKGQVTTIPAGFPQTYPPYAYPPYAYPPQAYPPQAYPPQAYSPQAYSPQTYPPQAYPPHAYPPQAYPPHAYHPQAYPPQAYPPQTSPPQTSPPQISPHQTSPSQTSSPALTHTSGAVQV